MLNVGDKLQGRYEIKEIRMGGLMMVYIAFDHVSEKLVTIETPRDKYLNHKDLIKRFLEQSRIVMKLRECPHIVRAERVERIDGKPYIFREYIDGWTLKDEIQNQSLDLIRSLDIAIQFCDGMDCVRNVDLGDGRKGVVHLDIKPSHIWITRQGVVKINGFHIAKPLGAPTAERPMGTPEYMSPEQFHTMDVDQRSDIYSFGGVLYEMLTGRRPFPEPDDLRSRWEHYRDCHQNVSPVFPVPRKSVTRADIKSLIYIMELADVVLKCLEKRPDDRHQSFKELREELIKIYRKLLTEQGTKTRKIDLTKFDEAIKRFGRLPQFRYGVDRWGSVPR